MMTRKERILSYSTIQVFLILNAIGLGVMYLADGVLLHDPAYQHQEVYAQHAIFGVVLLILAIWALARPRYASPAWRYRLLMIAAFTAYVALALTFIPGGPTAVWTYLSLAALYLYEARR